jgi:hypothetical protein
LGGNSIKEKITETTIIDTIQKERPRTIEQLLDSLQERFPASKEDAVDLILKLQQEGKIKLTKHLKQTPERFSSYIKTGEAQWFWITITFAVIATLVIFTIPETMFPLFYIRYFLGTIYVLWLPGYPLIKILFPITNDKSSKGPDIIEKAALNVGLSLVLVPLVGLLLNYTPWGIRLTSIVLSLFILIIIFSTIALIREHQTRIKQANQ